MATVTKDGFGTPDSPVSAYTTQERLRNWWDYHKGWVVFGTILCIGALSLIRDIFFRPKPDYQIAYVSTTPLPSAVLASLQQQLEAIGDDVNGDGRVLVELLTYDIGFDALSQMNVEATSANITRLTVDLTSGGVYILFLEDPQGFQARMGGLSYLDGTAPPLDHTASAEDWRQMVYPWESCPVLTSLELGTYRVFLDPDEREIDGQTAMERLYVARRVIRDDAQREAFAADERLWQRLTAGAFDQFSHGN